MQRSRWPLFLPLFLPLVAAVVWLTRAGEGSNPPPEPLPAEVAESQEPQKRSRAVTEKLHHSFGLMDPHAEGSYEFLIRNEGDAPLTLKPGITTCKCTLSDIPNRTIAPGGEGHVRLTWNTTEKIGTFRQAAEIATNDPDRPIIQFEIRGAVRLHLAITVEALTFADVRPGQSESRSFLVYSQAWDEFELAEGTSSLEGFKLTVQPASAKRLAEQVATSGFLVTYTVPANMPAGRFTHWFKLNCLPPASADQEQETIELAINGNVLESVGLVTPDLVGGDALKLGSIPHGRGKRYAMHLMVRDRPEGLQVRSIETSPDFLRVQVNKLGVTSTGTVKYSLTLEVPPDAPSGDYRLDKTGKVRILTDHPAKPEIDFDVQFTVLSPKSAPQALRD